MKRKSLAPWNLKKGQLIVDISTGSNNDRVAIYKAWVFKSL